MTTEYQPGRYCPLDYYYQPEQLRGPAACKADTLYVVGGLYGNPYALAAVTAAACREAESGGTVALVFNGDFHWLDVRPADFAALDAAVAEHHAIQGNVEAELASGDSGAGCGCAYPEEVPDAVVEKSNELMQRIKATAAAHPQVCRRLAGLPKTLAAEVGGTRVGIVHGDSRSLAGWRFAANRMPPEGDTPPDEIAEDFRRAGVRVFASTHTGLPFMQTFEVDGARCVVVNNGAAGLPCFRESRFGVATRISSRPEAPSGALYGCLPDSGLRVDAVRLDFDHAAWLAAFRETWPEGSPARALYERRIVSGPDFSLADAMRSPDIVPTTAAET